MKAWTEQSRFAIALILLGALALLAWWSDGSRARNGNSRIPWPNAADRNH